MTMEDLLWSVEPKASAEDRKRLITMLPGMLKHLHAGMERGELSEERRSAFLGALVDCHAMAVKAGLRGIAAVPETPDIFVRVRKFSITISYILLLDTIVWQRSEVLFLKWYSTLPQIAFYTLAFSACQ